MAERKVVEESYEGQAPSGAWRDGYETYTETHPELVASIRHLITGNAWAGIPGHPEVTVHKCWSGYSEYTITSEWQEIEIVWGKHRLYYEHISDFFKALSEAVKESRY